jgi:hypothetical protein
VTQAVKRGRRTTAQPVGVQAVYNPSSDTVSLNLLGRPQFAQGGQIIVIATPPFGLTDILGNPIEGNEDGLPGGHAVFTILPKARGITR